MEEERASGMLANMLAIASLIPALSGLQYSHSPFSVSVGRWMVLAVQSQPRLASLVRSRSLSLSGTSLGERSVLGAPGLCGIGIGIVAMPSKSSLLRFRGSVATVAGAATLRAESLVISSRREVRASMAGFVSSSLSSLTAETLPDGGYPQDWPARRRGRMRRLPILPMLSVVRRMSLSVQVLS